MVLLKWSLKKMYWDTFVQQMSQWNAVVVEVKLHASTVEEVTEVLDSKVPWEPWVL